MEWLHDFAQRTAEFHFWLFSFPLFIALAHIIYSSVKRKKIYFTLFDRIFQALFFTFLLFSIRFDRPYETGEIKDWLFLGLILIIWIVYLGLWYFHKRRGTFNS